MSFTLIEEAKTVLTKINEAGYEAYLVGGCVRDYCLNKTPYDYDITTNALPNVIQEIFKDYKTIDSGIKHGTVGILINNRVIEVTTYRVDGEYLDSRHPSKVEFTSLLKEDLKRRDFTMNALALSIDGKIIDYFNGKEDIENKIIRAVGDPTLRFTEDALRILRAGRFSSVLGFKIEQETSQAMIAQRKLLDNISKERINVELVKLLCGDNVKEVLLSYKVIILQIIPELLLLSSNDYSLIVNNIGDLKKDITTRLAYLLHRYDNEQVINILKSLKFDNKTVDAVSKIVSSISEKVVNDKVIIKKVLYKIDVPLFYKLIDIKRVIDPKLKYDQIKDIVETILKNNECYQLKKLKVNGSDLKKIGINGVKTGEVLNELLTAVINEEVENDKEKLLALAKKI
jgi:tRNA nucleotidyltransferase (CCA-adding enzyme)